MKNEIIKKLDILIKLLVAKSIFDEEKKIKKSKKTIEALDNLLKEKGDFMKKDTKCKHCKNGCKRCDARKVSQFIKTRKS